MKQLTILTLALLLSVSGMAAKFYPAKIILKDGTVLTGFAAHGKDIKFKETEKGKTKEYKSDDLKSAIYTIKNDSVQEFDRMVMYSGKKKINSWMQVVIRGKVTLYTYTYYTANSKAKSWGCWREGELFVTILKDSGSILNSYKKEVTTYFSDNADLSRKIKDDTYKSKDLELIVKEYNK